MYILDTLMMMYIIHDGATALGRLSPMALALSGMMPGMAAARRSTRTSGSLHLEASCCTAPPAVARRVSGQAFRGGSRASRGFPPILIAVRASRASPPFASSSLMLPPPPRHFALLSP